MGLGALDGMVSRWSDRFMQRFAELPDAGLSADAAAREYVVKDASTSQVDHYLRTGRREPLQTPAGKAFDMVPAVPGGLREGDIVLSNVAPENAEQSGLVVSVENALTHGEFSAHKATVSHAGIVARNAQGQLGVIHFMGGRQPAELTQYLTKLQSRFKPKFLRWDPIDRFFNFQAKGRVNTHSMVLRAPDSQSATRAARKAEQMAQTQISRDAQSGEVTVHPWFNKIPHSLAPEDRGGACSTFVNQAYDDAFHAPLRLPVTPEHLAISPNLRVVGDRRVTQVQAL